jgi:hypothetical protein
MKSHESGRRRIYVTCLKGGEARNNQPDLQMKKHAHVVT